MPESVRRGYIPTDEREFVQQIREKNTEQEDICMDRIEELLKAPYWIIDILPRQVPKDSPGQYFAVEEYFLREQLSSIKQRHIRLVLKLNCYMDVTVDGIVNPDPAQIAEIMNERYVYIMVGTSMLLSEPDDTHMTLFDPDDRLLELVTALASGEGMFVWKGADL